MTAGRRVPAFVTAVGVFAAVLVSAAPANACSCGIPDIDTVLDEGGAVAIVTRLDAGGTDATFRVEEVLGSNLPATLHGEVDGGIGCQPSVFAGELAALAFRQETDWVLPMCSELDVTTVLARIHGEPGAESTEPPVAVATGDFGGSQLVTLDRQGEVVAWDRRPGVARQVAVCPGGRTVAALSFPRVGETTGPLELAVYDAVTLDLQRTAPLPISPVDIATALHCADAGGTVVRLIARKDEGNDSSQVITVDGSRVTSVPIPPVRWVAPLADGFVAEAVNVNSPTLLRVRSDGTHPKLIPLAGLGGIAQLAVAPDGRTVAVSGYEVSPPTASVSPDPVVLTVDSRTGKVLARWRPDTYPRSLTWTPDGRLLARVGYSNSYSPPYEDGNLLVLDRRLRVLETRAGTRGNRLTTVGDTAVTFGGGRLVATARTGASRVVENLWLAAAEGVAGLSDAGFAPGETAPEVEPASVVRAVSQASDDSRGTVVLGIVSGVAAAGLAGFVALRRRRRA